MPPDKEASAQASLGAEVTRQIPFERHNARPGTYVLILCVTTEQVTPVGRLGIIPLTRGYLTYIGNAFALGGVRARVLRHARVGRSRHWHIDYLNAAATITDIWFTHDPEHREHTWANIISGMGQAKVPLPGFGASDCSCNTHLFWFRDPPKFTSFCRKALKILPGHEAIRRTG